jgi:hypothetical protein
MSSILECSKNIFNQNILDEKQIHTVALDTVCKDISLSFKNDLQR